MTRYMLFLLLICSTASAQFEAEVVPFQIDSTKTAAQTQDITVTDFGDAQAVMVVVSGSETDSVTTEETDLYLCIGLYDGTNTRCQMVRNAGGGVSNDDSERHRSTSQFIRGMDKTGGFDGTCTVDFITDGIQLTYSQQFVTDYRGYAILIKGADAVVVGEENSGSPTDSWDVTINPDLMIFSSVDDGGSNAGAWLSIGAIAMGTGRYPNQAAYSSAIGTASTPACEALLTQQRMVVGRSVLTEQLIKADYWDGTTLNTIHGDGGGGGAAMRADYLAIDLPDSQVAYIDIGEHATSGTTTLATPNSQVTGGTELFMAFGGRTVSETSETDANAGLFFLGACDADLDQAVAFTREQDGAASYQSVSSYSDSHVAITRTGAGTNNANSSVTNIDSSGDVVLGYDNYEASSGKDFAWLVVANRKSGSPHDYYNGLLDHADYHTSADLRAQGEIEYLTLSGPNTQISYDGDQDGARIRLSGSTIKISGANHLVLPTGTIDDGSLVMVWDAFYGDGWGTRGGSDGGLTTHKAWRPRDGNGIQAGGDLRVEVRHNYSSGNTTSTDVAQIDMRIYGQIYATGSEGTDKDPLAPQLNTFELQSGRWYRYVLMQEVVEVSGHPHSQNVWLWVGDAENGFTKIIGDPDSVTHTKAGDDGFNLIGSNPTRYQRVVLGGATGGTYTLTMFGETTSAIDFDETLANIATTIETEITGVTDVDITGSSNSYEVEFVNPTNADDQYITIDGGNLTGGGSTRIDAGTWNGFGHNELEWDTSQSGTSHDTWDAYTRNYVTLRNPSDSTVDNVILSTQGLGVEKPKSTRGIRRGSRRIVN